MYMTESKAIKLAAKYGPLVLGKPISIEVNWPIEEVIVRDMGDNNFNVLLISDLPDSDVDRLYRTLKDYLKEFNIPFDSEDFEQH